MCDLLSYANTLRLLVDRDCRYLVPYTQRQMVEEQFLDGLPIYLRECVRLACHRRNMHIDQLVNATRDLMDQAVIVAEVTSPTTAELEEQAKPMIDAVPINSMPTETVYESLDTPQVDEVCGFIDGPVATIDKEMPADKDCEPTVKYVKLGAVASTIDQIALKELFESAAEINLFDFLFEDVPLNDAPKNAQSIEEAVIDAEPRLLLKTSTAYSEVCDVHLNSENAITDNALSNETVKEVYTIAHNCETNILCIAAVIFPPKNKGTPNYHAFGLPSALTE